MIKYLFLAIIFIFSSVLAAEPGSDKRITFAGEYILPQYKAQMTVKELEAHFDLIEISAYNPWENREDMYKGIPLSQLVQKFSNNQSSSLDLLAIDRYSVNFTKQEWIKYNIILVTQKNNKYQPVSDKGPLRIIYPNYDENNIEQKLMLTKWMWMIKRIEFN